MPKAKKNKTILQSKPGLLKSEREQKQKSKPQTKTHGSLKPTKQHTKTKQWSSNTDGGKRLLTCCSVIDRQAAFAIQKLVEADETKKKGASLKSLTLAPHIKEKRATYAVTCQALKCKSYALPSGQTHEQQS